MQQVILHQRRINKRQSSIFVKDAILDLLYLMSVTYNEYLCNQLLNCTLLATLLHLNVRHIQNLGLPCLDTELTIRSATEEALLITERACSTCKAGTGLKLYKTYVHYHFPCTKNSHQQVRNGPKVVVLSSGASVDLVSGKRLHNSLASNLSQCIGRQMAAGITDRCLHGRYRHVAYNARVDVNGNAPSTADGLEVKTWKAMSRDEKRTSLIKDGHTIRLC